MKLKASVILGAAILSLASASVAFAGTWGGTKPNWTYSVSKPSSWQLIDGKWYYFNDMNCTATGVLALGDKMYYLDTNTAAMFENQWLQMGDDWWYYGADGAAVKNSWISYNGKWYYMGADCKMLKSTTTPDGYYVNQNGEWVEPSSNANNTTNTNTSTTKADKYYSSAFNFNLKYGKGSTTFDYIHVVKKPKSFGEASSISFDVDGFGDGELVLTFLEDGYGTDIGSDVVYGDGSHTIDIDEKTTSVRFTYKAEDPYNGDKGTLKITNLRFEK